MADAFNMEGRTRSETVVLDQGLDARESGRVQQIRPQEAQGTKEVVLHPKVDDDLDSLPQKVQDTFHERVESLRNGERHSSTHPLNVPLKGWFGTSVGGNQYRMVHRYQGGDLQVLSVGNHDEAYNQGARRAVAVSEDEWHYGHMPLHQFRQVNSTDFGYHVPHLRDAFREDWDTKRDDARYAGNDPNDMHTLIDSHGAHDKDAEFGHPDRYIDHLKKNIEQHGLREPLHLGRGDDPDDPHLNLQDGNHRAVVVHELGIDPVPVKWHKNHDQLAENDGLLRHRVAMGQAGPDYDNLTFHHGEHPLYPADNEFHTLFAHHPEHGDVGRLTYRIQDHPDWTGFESPTVHVTMMHVEPEHQRRGVASQLMNHLENEVHKDTLIDHGSRRPEGHEWAKSQYNDAKGGKPNFSGEFSGGKSQYTKNGRPWNVETKKPYRMPKNAADWDEFRRVQDGQHRRYERAGVGGSSEDRDRYFGTGQMMGNSVEDPITPRMWIQHSRAERPGDMPRDAQAHEHGFQLGKQHAQRGTIDTEELDREHGHSLHAEHFLNGYHQGLGEGFGEHVAASKLGHFVPHLRIFTGTCGLDHRLWDANEKLKPEARTYIMHSVAVMWGPRYHEWSKWARVYFAGSEASEWTSDTLEGNNDFDVLIGVDYDGFRKANPAYRDWSDAEITDQMNQEFRQFNSDHVWLPIRAVEDVRGIASWHPSQSSMSNGYETSTATDSYQQQLSLERLTAPYLQSAVPSNSQGSVEISPEGRDPSDPSEQNASGVEEGSIPSDPMQGGDQLDADSVGRSMSATGTSARSMASRLSSTMRSRRMGVGSVDPQTTSMLTTTTPAVPGSSRAVSASGASFAPDTTGRSGPSVTSTFKPQSRISLDTPNEPLPDGWLWTGPWSRTTYCNPQSYDIRKIKPYAAYDVGKDEWVVKPPHLPHWGLDKLSPAVQKVLRATDSLARDVLKLPEPERTQQGAALFDAWHSDRSRAFGPNGEGWYDIANLREKWLDQAGLWAQLVDCKHRFTEGLGAAVDWSNTPKTAAAFAEHRVAQHKTASPWFDMGDVKRPRPKSVRRAGFAGFVADTHWDRDFGENGKEADQPDHLDDHLGHFVRHHSEHASTWDRHGEMKDIDLHQPIYATQSHVSQYHIDRYRKNPGATSWALHNSDPLDTDDYQGHYRPLFVTHQGRVHAIEGHHRVAGALQEGADSIKGWHYNLDEHPIVQNRNGDDCPACHRYEAESHAERRTAAGVYKTLDQLAPHERAAAETYHDQMKEEGFAHKDETPDAYHYELRQEPRHEFLKRYMDADNEFKEAYGPDEFQAHHEETLKNHPIPHYPKRNRWPLIVRDDNPNYVDDGYHRMHSYMRDGATHIPTMRMHWRGSRTASRANDLYGKGLNALFPHDEDGPRSTAPTPWPQAGRRKDRKTFDESVVARSITHPHEFSVEDVDPRELRATQPSVTRDGVKHYMEDGGDYGKNRGDHQLGNDVPRVYHRLDDDQKIILSGHHRAAKALLAGHPLRAMIIRGNWGAARGT